MAKDVEVTAFGYGVLALTNPWEWPNQAECEAYKHLLTGKSVYVWPLVFNAYVEHLSSRKGVTFESELKRIDEYLERHLRSFRYANPVDFSNAGSQYVRSKPG